MLVLSIIFALATLGALALPLCTTLFLRRQGRIESSGAMPEKFSMLVPARGVPHGFVQNVESWIAQDLAGLFEIIVCVEHADDPIIAALRPLIARDGRLSLVVAGFEPGSLGKMNNLLHALSVSTGDGLLLVDADARFDRPDYLSRFVGPLASRNVGLVTCHPAYRDARSLGAALIGLAINVDLLPRIAIRTLSSGGQLATAIGTTLALRRDTLDALGGLEFLRRQLLMDTKLAEAVVKLGRTVYLHPQPVGVHARTLSIADAFRQANRWHLGIRGVVSRSLYASYCLQRVVFGAALICAILEPSAAVAAMSCVAARILTAAIANHQIIRDPSFWLIAPAIPIVDTIMAVSALRAYVDNTFVWSGRSYELGPGAIAKPRSPR